MLPLRDKNPTHRIPIVNTSIIAINISVFFYELSLGEQLQQFFQQFGLVPVSFVFGISQFTLSSALPLFTSIFLHGGWMHLAGNMLYLWIFGDNVEDKLGHVRYGCFYLLCGIGASLVHVAIDTSSTIPTVGASGAISGILGAYLLMFPGARVVTIIPVFFFLQVAELPALMVLGFWFVVQFFNGLLSLGYETAGMGGVAWWAHIGGFIVGLLLIKRFRKFR
jgi:membrane associated rhomboid family serine protease